MGALFHAYILFILGDKEQGISVLEEYQKEDQSIIWNLLPVYINYNEREKIINAIESIADADFLHTMPPQIYISLFYLLKQDGRFWGTLMQKIPWGNNVNHCVFSEFIRLMSGEKEYGYKLAHIENDCPDILKFLYPTIYSEIEEYDLAIDRAKDLLPQCPTINEHTFYYIELLETAKTSGRLDAIFKIAKTWRRSAPISSWKRVEIYAKRFIIILSQQLLLNRYIKLIIRIRIQ